MTMASAHGTDFSSTPTRVYLAGIGNSGPDHWQRIWHDRDPGGVWVQHSSWDHPVRDGWVRELDTALRSVDGPKVLVAHSLGCALVTEWAAQHEDDGVVGAFLVAFPDVHGPGFPAQAIGFGEPKHQRLPFRTVMVAGGDDPYGTFEHSVELARALGADLVNVGAKGHINAASGLGDWPEGEALFDRWFGSGPDLFPDVAGVSRVVVSRLPGGTPVDVSVLDDEERARLGRFLRDVDRRRYGHAHALLRRMLGEWLGVEPSALRFARAGCPRCGTPHGRPVLTGAAAGAVEFSLSHGGDHVMVGISDRVIGVDVDRVPSLDTVDRVVTTLHPAEQAQIMDGAQAGRSARFARTWTRKEAYLKALGLGLGQDLDADDLTVDPPGWTVLDRRVDATHHVAVALPRR